MIPTLSHKWTQPKKREWHGWWNGLERKLAWTAIIFIKTILTHTTQLAAFPHFWLNFVTDHDFMNRTTQSAKTDLSCRLEVCFLCNSKLGTGFSLAKQQALCSLPWLNVAILMLYSQLSHKWSPLVHNKVAAWGDGCLQENLFTY